MHGSKAQTLILLSDAKEAPFVVDPFIIFSVGEWYQNPQIILDRIDSGRFGNVVIVRSSALLEDSEPTLSPGLFYSALGVRTSNATELRIAIQQVISSYERHHLSRNASEKNEVIVQRQLLDVQLAGVVNLGFSNGLYFIIDFDDESGRTDTVTKGSPCKHIALWRDDHELPSPWLEVRKACLYVEKLIGERLIIEFAISKRGNVHIFQARLNGIGGVSSIRMSDRNKISVLVQKAKTFILENPGPWSDMADWNPAEMLGDRPRPLSISLYQFLVTETSWLCGRTSLGYRDVTPPKLIETIAGKPYVNIRKSFLSLTPSTLPAELAERYVNDRILVLREHPELHDKVEFDIMFTVHDVCEPRRTQNLKQRGFSPKDISILEDKLSQLTSNILCKWKHTACRDEAITTSLKNWREHNRFELAEPIDINRLIRYIQNALIRCRDLGVVPFARQARLAFIAQDILRRLVVAEYLDQGWLENLWSGVDTIAKMVSRALIQVMNGEMSRIDFERMYGHLRSRTYDILCPRYDSLTTPLNVTKIYFAEPSDIPKLSRLQSNAILIALNRINASLTPENMIDYACHSLQMREKTKFIFTSLLSDIIESIAILGNHIGFTREEMSYLTVEDLLNALTSIYSIRTLTETLKEAIYANKEEWSTAQHLDLPDLLFSNDDLFLVQHRISKPNFITDAKVTAEIHIIENPSPDMHATINGKLVLVEAADPGLDWLFTFRIAGLITKYGGAFSHMAVRCSEFSIPAAIGCGALLFGRLSKARQVCLNCKERRIEIFEDLLH